MGCAVSNDSTANSSHKAAHQDSDSRLPGDANAGPAGSKDTSANAPHATSAAPPAKRASGSATPPPNRAADTPSSSEEGGKTGKVVVASSGQPQHTASGDSPAGSPLQHRSATPQASIAPASESPSIRPVVPAPPPLAGGLPVVDVVDVTGRKVRTTLATKAKVDAVVTWIESSLFLQVTSASGSGRNVVNQTPPPSTRDETASVQSWHTMPHPASGLLNSPMVATTLLRKPEFVDPQLQASKPRPTVKLAPDTVSSTSRHKSGNQVMSTGSHSSAIATPQTSEMQMPVAEAPHAPAPAPQPQLTRSDTVGSNSHNSGLNNSSVIVTAETTRIAPPSATPVTSNFALAATPFPQDGVIMASNAQGEGDVKMPNQQALVASQQQKYDRSGPALPYARNRAGEEDANHNPSVQNAALTASLAMHASTHQHHNFGDRASQSVSTIGSTVGPRGNYSTISPGASRTQFPEGLAMSSPAAPRAVTPSNSKLPGVNSPFESSGSMRDMMGSHQQSNRDIALSPQPASASRPRPPDAAEQSSAVFASSMSVVPTTSPPARRLDRDETAPPNLIDKVLDNDPHS